MAVGAFIEPLIVVTLLFGGAWFNRDKDYDFWKDKHGSEVDLHLKRSDVVEEREYSRTILFLVFLFYVTTTRRRQISNGRIQDDFDTVGPTLYEARRRTMAMCNLLAFIVFTFWPCMPPRLLSDPEYDGIDAVEAESFGFVDTVHGEKGESSVWTTNKFLTNAAAMPSLHFGYSLLVGLTIATVPIMGLRRYSWKRVIIIIIGMSYPTLILTAIVATANHFILDAMAGAIICGIAWKSNGLLLNLFILEDYFLWMVRIHKPVNYADFRY